jgi:hypothetical protein
MVENQIDILLVSGVFMVFTGLFPTNTTKKKGIFLSHSQILGEFFALRFSKGNKKKTWKTTNPPAPGALLQASDIFRKPCFDSKASLIPRALAGHW